MLVLSNLILLKELNSSDKLRNSILTPSKIHVISLRYDIGMHRIPMYALHSTNIGAFKENKYINISCMRFSYAWYNAIESFA